MRLTKRDLEILRCFRRYRFLRSDHLTSLLPGSKQQLLRRLQLLFHHGYLERPRCQIDYYRSGSRRITYGFGNKGASVLARESALPFRRFDWQWKNRVTRFFLEHALLVSDILVAVELACRARPEIKLILPDEMPRWKVALNRVSKVGVVPDAAFALESNGKRCWFFVEADRGTMPIQRRNLRQSSFQRKLLAYEATWTQDIHHTDLNVHRFRVLTITNSPARLASMRETCRSLKRGHGLFLFIQLKTLREEPDFFTLQWLSSREGQTVAVFETSRV
jgi:hypothetical protein